LRIYSFNFASGPLIGSLKEPVCSKLQDAGAEVPNILEKLESSSLEIYILRMVGLCTLFFYLIGSFLLGGIPFGLIYVKVFYKQDVRTVGSGNIGTTNVLRAAGIPVALLTMVSDFLKSFIPVFFSQKLFGNNFYSQIVWLSTIIGHCFSPYLGFRGGKGVATFFGGLLALDFYMALYSILIWLIVFLLTGFVSLGSMVTSIVPAVVSMIKGYDLESILLFLLGSLIIIYRHKSNIARLFSGTENKFELRRK